MEDKNFAEHLNILRAGVLGANDGIISIAGVVIGVASATSNIWFILISALSAIFAGAFSMAGGEYVSVSTQKDTEEAAVAKEQALLDRSPESARESLYQTFLSQGDCETEAEVKVNQAFSKNPIKVLVEEKYGVDMEEITNPWHAAVSSFLSFSVGSLPPTLAILLFPDPYRIPITAVVVALTLILTGYVSAKLGKAPVKQAMLRNLAVGLLTMLVTYVVGQVFHVNV
ncbi:MAG: VIT1/CCC1 transporter family protein [Streptococcus thermophilus]|uniref:VIT1/CCC1 transporter family protein n=1 Tax=Streptococcus thermophilus TaxID=1308 RepID=UPI0011095EDA|nr:VIT family protein [Streptococcus thermophilus]MBO1148959.1 VIT family protein [Streptococcus thermophilus]MBO1157123.1 VIT family protein [Streptococcus thermophilus]MBO1158682.1 VIT family protein [Streptococcus thermophilus]MBO1160370.1 VIT family protein [Streptococcus thermophilus]MBO1162019.1 VIT family protein [Streptococcus thermophilus]